MSNTFTKPSDLIAGTTARAADINLRVDATETGFDNVEVVTNRSIKLPVGTSGDQVLSESAPNRALKEIGFDASGDLVLISSAFQWKGDWATSTAYIKNDMVRDSSTKNIYTVQADHTSGALATDISSAKLSLAINVADVETAKTAAQTAQTAAELAETNAETAETNAETAEANAAADLVLTNADVVLTHADVVLAEADKVQTGLDRAAVAADLVLTNADVVLTHADVVLAEADKVQTGLDKVATNADVVLTHADVVLAEADKVQTGLDRVATNADVVLTHADVALAEADKVQTGVDRAAVAADLVLTNADVVLTHADVVLTHADVVLTHADVVLAEADKVQTGLDRVATNADVVLTHADVVLAEADKVQTGLDRAAVAADLVLTNQDTIDTAADLVLTNADVVLSEAAKVAAELAYDSFDDRYLGAKSSDPATDNDGAALLTGALYFNSTSSVMKVYSGSAWVAAYASLAGSLLVANNLSDVASASSARANIGVGAADFIASGTLPNGAPVVLKSDGTVGAATETIIVAEGFTTNQFSTGSTLSGVCMFDPNTPDKIIILYVDRSNSDYGTAVVGTVSGTTLSFGTPSVFLSGTTDHIGGAMDSNTVNSFVVAYEDGSNSNYGTVRVGTVSGTSISFGAATVFTSGASSDHNVEFVANTANKFVLTHRSADISYNGAARVGTVSGTTVSIGTAYIFNNSQDVAKLSLSCDPHNPSNFVLTYRDYGDSNRGSAVIGVISGTSISYGTEAVFNSGFQYNDTAVAFDLNISNKLVVAYQDSSNSGYGTAVVGTVSGTSISFGTPVVFNSSSTGYYIHIASDPYNANSFAIGYADTGNSRAATAVIGTVSGTTISFGTEVVYNSNYCVVADVAYDPHATGKLVVHEGHSAGSSLSISQAAHTATTQNLTSTNFLGISTAAYTNAQTATIMLQGGISTNQTGLTIGSTYYVQPDGTLATTVSTPRVEAGKALSATSLFLSDLPVAPSLAGTADFVASGTLPNGAPVVLKSDGTVAVVSSTGVSTPVAESIPAGSATVFNNTGSTMDVHVAFDPNNANKFVVIYRDQGNSSYGTAIVGTVSGTSMTFGTSVVFYSGGNQTPYIAFDPNTAGKFVVVFRVSATADGTVIVGTLSGTSVSFGTAVTFNTNNTSGFFLAFDPNTAGKFVVVYKDYDNSDGEAIVGTVAGTSVSFGTPVVFHATPIAFADISFDPNTSGKFVVAYRDENNSSYGTALVGTLAGTSASFGTAVVFNAGNTNNLKVSYDSNTAGKFVISYKNSSNHGTAIVGTVAGTSVSFGTAVVFAAESIITPYIAFDPNTADTFVIAYRAATGHAIAIVGTVAGTSVSFGTKFTLGSPTSSEESISFDPNTAGKFVVTWQDYGNSRYGTAIVGQLAATVAGPNLTSTNFLGTSTAAYTDTQTATVMLQGGISTNQSGLTIGSTYYVQQDGSLSTTESSPSVIAGKALSTTDLFLANWTDVYTDPSLLVKTADLTVYAGDSIVVGAGGITVTLPSSPAIGDSVIIKDGTGAVSTTPFTVAGNGSNIVSSASSLTFNSDWAEVRFVFINATIGWSV